MRERRPTQPDTTARSCQAPSSPVATRPCRVCLAPFPAAPMFVAAVAAVAALSRPVFGARPVVAFYESGQARLQFGARRTDSARGPRVRRPSTRAVGAPCVATPLLAPAAAASPRADPAAPVGLFASAPAAVARSGRPHASFGGWHPYRGGCCCYAWLGGRRSSRRGGQCLASRCSADRRGPCARTAPARPSPILRHRRGGHRRCSRRDLASTRPLGSRSYVGLRIPAGVCESTALYRCACDSCARCDAGGRTGCVDSRDRPQRGASAARRLGLGSAGGAARATRTPAVRLPRARRPDASPREPFGAHSDFEQGAAAVASSTSPGRRLSAGPCGAFGATCKASADRT